MNKTYQGSCLCGEITFAVSGIDERAAQCHCTMCRKFHGAAAAPLVSVKQIHWLSGDDVRKDYVADNGTTRTFCSACGSSLGFRCKVETAPMEIAIGTLDDEVPVTIDAHIYVDNKANWDHIADGLPQFAQGRE
ncbi:GFA family protein [Marinomonas transparens]|uniref:GFA family protein n=1 Tax=Marinomonas transparens TaxID=2795388 RepID=A0A934N5S4_9GAMM|nr:GFA family protein [Marinomonas transparens]MBJ7537341.1 GFA family protein [Marinomonas transparens]